MKTTPSDSPPELAPDGGLPTTTCCASFEGSETFVIRNHEMVQKWQGVGQTEHGHPQEKILMWTDHLIEFDCRERPFRRGDKVEVDGVEMFVTGYTGRWLIAKGREMHFRHNAGILAQPTNDSTDTKNER